MRSEPHYLKTRALFNYVLIMQILACHGVHLSTSCKAINNDVFDFVDVCPI